MMLTQFQTELVNWNYRNSGKKDFVLNLHFGYFFIADHKIKVLRNLKYYKVFLCHFLLKNIMLLFQDFLLNLQFKNQNLGIEYLRFYT